MRKIFAAVLALGVVAAATTPSVAFDTKTFWDMHPPKAGS